MKIVVTPCTLRLVGLDIVASFYLEIGQINLLLVAIDYFLKWVKAEQLAQITEDKMPKYISKNIVYCFGIAQRLISDIARQYEI